MESVFLWSLIHWKMKSCHWISKQKEGTVMKTFFIVCGIVLVVVLLLFIYACCVASGRATEEEEKCWKEEKLKQEKGSSVKERIESDNTNTIIDVTMQK